MPPIGTVFETYRPATADFAVLWLHGGDRAAIEQDTGEIWNALVAPKPEGLAAAAAITREHIRKKIKTYINVNNHYEGSAPLSVDRLIRTLETGTPGAEKQP